MYSPEQLAFYRSLSVPVAEIAAHVRPAESYLAEHGVLWNLYIAHMIHYARLLDPKTRTEETMPAFHQGVFDALTKNNQWAARFRTASSDYFVLPRRAAIRFDHHATTSKLEVPMCLLGFIQPEYIQDIIRAQALVPAVQQLRGVRGLDNVIRISDNTQLFFSVNGIGVRMKGIEQIPVQQLHPVLMTRHIGLDAPAIPIHSGNDGVTSFTLPHVWATGILQDLRIGRPIEKIHYVKDTLREV